MGNSISPHIDNARKTGVLQLTMHKLEKAEPADMAAVQVLLFIGDMAAVYTVPYLFKFRDTPPEEIDSLRGNLRTLDISKNRLITLRWIVDFKMLKNFTADDNKAGSLPENISILAKLETLSVARNGLTSLPASVADLRMLKVVNLSGNALSCFPPQLCGTGLKQLDFLDLSGNRITELPEAVKNLQCLELVINQNRLASLNDGLAQCPRLKVLRLEENCLPLAAFTLPIMKDSLISIFAVEGNVFHMKDFQNVDGYSAYMDRYTATKKKVV